MAFPIVSSVPGAAATGLSGQGHLFYATNQGAFWLPYLSGTQAIGAVYSANLGSSWAAPSYADGVGDSTTISGSSFTLQGAHNSEGRNFAFGYADIASTDVLHVMSSYNPSSSSASAYHARTTLGTTWTHTNAEAQTGSTENPGASYASGGACTLLSGGQVVDECSYLGGGNGAAVAWNGTHIDGGTAWLAAMASSFSEGSTSDYNGSAVFLDLGSGNVLAIWDNSSHDIASSNTGWDNLRWLAGSSAGIGVAWSGSAANVLGTAVTPTLPGNWGACVRTSSDIHLVALSDDASNFVHYRWNGTSWSSSGNAIGALTLAGASNISLVSDGTSVWAAVIDSSSNVQVNKWTSGGWGGWNIQETANNTRACITGAYDGSAHVMWAWTENTGSQFNIAGTLLPTASLSFTVSPSTIPANHAGNITLTLTGSGTSWTSGTTFTLPTITGLSLVSKTFHSATSVTLVVTTGSGTSTGNISDSTDSATASLTVATPSFAISPASGNVSTSPSITATGTNTLWTHETASTLFSVGGGTSPSISSISVVGDTSATFTLATGSTTGTLTITDAPTGDTANFSVTLVPSFAVSPSTIPKGHAGNITLTVTGSHTSWVSGTTTFTLPTITGLALVSTSINNGTQVATLTVTTGTGAATGNISDSLDSATASLTVAVPSFTIAQRRGTISTSPTLTVTGVNTLWTHETASTLFSVSGGTSPAISSISVSSDTSATFTLATGSANGTLTITDTPTSDTASFLVGPLAWTSQRNGNWNVASGTNTSPWYDNSTQSGWNSAPSATYGDTATLVNNLAITDSESIGDGTASTVLTCAAGTLTVSGGTLTIRGNATFGEANSEILVNRLVVESSGSASASLLLDGNSSVTPIVSLADDSTLVLTGSAFYPVAVATKSGTSGNPGYITCSGSYGLYLNASYVNFSRLGGSATTGLGAPSVEDLSGTANPPFLMAYCNIDSCGQLPGVGVTGATVNFQITNCTWTNPQDANAYPYVIGTTNALTTGTRLYAQNVTGENQGVAQLTYMEDLLMDDSYFGSMVATQKTAEPCWKAVQNSFLYQSAGYDGADTIHMGGNFTDNFFLIGTIAVDVLFLCTCSTPGSTISGNIFQSAVTSGDSPTSGLVGFGEEGSVTLNQYVNNNIVLPAFGGGFSGVLTGNYNNSTQDFVNNLYAEHNTQFLGATTASPISMCNIIADDTPKVERANEVNSFRGNLGVRTGAAPGIGAYLVSNDPTSNPVNDALAAADCDYNAYTALDVVGTSNWSSISGSGGNHGSGGEVGSVYDTPMAYATTPGTHDVSLGVCSSLLTAGPQFVGWNGVAMPGLLEFDSSMGGPGTMDHALGALRGQFAAGNPSNPYYGDHIPGYTTAALNAFVKSACRPRNPALRAASYPGDTSTADASGNAWRGGSPGIGAMSMPSSATTKWFPGLSWHRRRR